MRKNIQELLTAIGCTPLTAIGLFIVGAFIGEVVEMNLPSPPPWLLIPAGLLPVFAALSYRAYRIRHDANLWIDSWRRKRVPVTEESPQSVEEIWLKTQMENAPLPRVKWLLDSALLWGWLTVMSFLALAYIFVWLGLAAAQQL